MSKSKSDFDSDDLGSVRAYRFEVFKVESEDYRATYQSWHEISFMCREIVNSIWEQWLVWHVERRSGDLIREFLDLFASWKAAGKPAASKPKDGVEKWGAEFDANLRKYLAKYFHHVHERVRGLLQKHVKGKLVKLKAANGSLPGSSAILLHHQSLPSSTKPQPIPFDTRNCTAPEKGADGFWRMVLRLDRFMSATRAGKPIASSRSDSIQLRVKPRSGGEAVINRIASGEYQFKGSSLYYDKKNRKWFVLLCYQMPAGQQAKNLDGGRVAVLRSAGRSPWRLRINGRSFRRGGDGQYIATQRHRLLTHRWSRQENYRHAGSSNKGHGRERALAPIERLSHWWKNFTKTVNHQLTKDVVDSCLRDGVGRLIYIQPTGSRRDARFLSTAGKKKGRRDSTGWDWAQVASMLSYKCKEAGIHLEIRKSGGDSGEEESGSEARIDKPITPQAGSSGRGSVRRVPVRGAGHRKAGENRKKALVR